MRPSPWFKILLLWSCLDVCWTLTVVHWCVPFGILVTPVYEDISGMSQDCPGTSFVGSPQSSDTHLQGCIRTVSGHLSWDLLDTKSHLHTGMSQDYPGTSLMGSSRHKVTLACRDVPGQSWEVFHGIHQTPSLLGFPGGCCRQFQASHYVWTVLGRVWHLQATLDIPCCFLSW